MVGRNLDVALRRLAASEGDPIARAVVRIEAGKAVG